MITTMSLRGVAIQCPRRVSFLGLAVAAQGCLLGGCGGAVSHNGGGGATGLEPKDSAADSGASSEPPVSGSDGGASSKPKPAEPFAGSPEEYWATIERIARARLEECLVVRADYSLGGSFGTRILPTELFVQAIVEERVRAFRSGLDEGRLAFDAAAAGACLLKTSQQSCYEYRRERALGTDCHDDPLVVGRVQTGGFCERWEECASPDDFCDRLENACPASACKLRARSGESCAVRPCVEGTRCTDVEPYLCVPSPAPGLDGKACSLVGCDAGLFCSTGRTCRRYVERIDCQANGDCPFLEVCLLQSGATSGVCGPGRGAGEVCRPGAFGQHDCSFSTDCRLGADGVPVCTSPWAKPGERCRNTGANGGIVCIEGFCNVLDQTQEGICIPLLGQGDTCTLGNCAAGLECTTNGCQPVSSEPCTDSSCSEAMYCTVWGQCAPATPAGEPCRASSECGFGSACVDRTCRLCP
jgi:hypothetical protein